MAIFRPGVRQGALQASRQGNLGQFLGAHPRAQQQWNQAARRPQAGMGGRQSMLGTRNANAQLQNMTLGQASGGRPAPIAAGPPQGAGAGSGGGGAGAPAPPTTQPQPPGAQYGGPAMSTLGGFPGFNAGGYGFNPYGGGGGYGQFPQMGGMSGGNMYGRMNPNIPPGLQGNQALQGLMGSVNPGMQSVLGSRLGQMGYGDLGAMGTGMQAPGQQFSALGAMGTGMQPAGQGPTRMQNPNPFGQNFSRQQQPPGMTQMGGGYPGMSGGMMGRFGGGQMGSYLSGYGGAPQGQWGY